VVVVPIAQRPPVKAAQPAPGSRDPRHVLGRLGEDLAVAHLDRLGFAVLERNVRTRHGEIDLIAFDGRALVFVEVKTSRTTGRRRTPMVDGPLERLRPRQRMRLRRLAVAWLSEQRTDRPAAREIRFDAIGVTVDAHDRLLRLDHLEAAW
jgi:putative endonuclease